MNEVLATPQFAGFRLTESEKRYVRLKVLGADAEGDVKAGEFKDLSKVKMKSVMKQLASNQRAREWLKERDRLLDDFAYREALFGQLDDDCLTGLLSGHQGDVSYLCWTSATKTASRVGKLPLPFLPAVEGFAPINAFLTLDKETISRRIPIDVHEEWAMDICGASVGVAVDKTGALLIRRSGYGCYLDPGTGKVVALGKADFGDVDVSGVHHIEGDGKRLTAIVELASKGDSSHLRRIEFSLDKDVRNDRPLSPCRMIYMGRMTAGGGECFFSMDLHSNKVLAFCGDDEPRVVKNGSFSDAAIQTIRRWVTLETVDGRDSPLYEPRDFDQLSWDRYATFLLRDQMRALPVGNAVVMVRAYPDGRGVLVSRIVDFVAKDIGTIGESERVLDVRSVLLGGKVAVFTVEVNEANKIIQFKTYLISEVGIQERASWRDKVRFSGEFEDIGHVPLFDAVPIVSGCRLYQAPRFEASEKLLVTEFDEKGDVISKRRATN